MDIPAPSPVSYVSSELIDEPPAPEEKPPARRRRVLWVLVIVLLLAAGLYGVYAGLTANIRHIEVTRDDLGEDRPAKAASDALNILVLGSDQQDDKDGDYRGERTDTIMVVHLSARRNEAAVISFPRDLRVQLPKCRAREGLPGQRGQRGMINASFTVGGIGCIWKTIETLTGIHIDHFVKVDFTGFKSMVDAAGGVELCISEPIHDKYVQLNLPAGLQTLQGEEALGYVRTRHSLGDGSDIGRIQRQQHFLSAMVTKLMSGGILAHPVRLFGFLDAVGKSVTTDPGLTPRAMIEIALAVRGLSSDHIHFVIAPWRNARGYPGRVELLDGPARKLFRMIAADQPLSEPKETRLAASQAAGTKTGIRGTDAASASPATTPGSTAHCTVN